MGGQQRSTIGDCAVGGHHLQRSNELALADWHIAHRRPGVFLQRHDQAALFAWEVNAGAATEAKAVDPLAETGRSQALPDRDRADVARLGKDSRRVERDPATFVRFINDAVSDLN